MQNTTTGGDNTVPYIAHDAFRTGLPFGHFHVVVNPVLAKSYVLHLTRAKYVTLAAIGVGVALALSSYVVAGGVLVALGIAGNRLVRRQAGPILLHLAARNEAIYTEATTHGVMEVRRLLGQLSAVKPMRLTSGPQRSNSACWLAACCSGVELRAMRPICSRPSATALSRSAATMPALAAATTGAGVRAGA